jgi:hypothetical protein
MSTFTPGRYAIVKNGVVTNVVRYIALPTDPNAVLIPASTITGKGWTYANGVFTPPTKSTVLAPATPPTSCLLWQLRAAMDAPQLQAFDRSVADDALMRFAATNGGLRVFVNSTTFLALALSSGIAASDFKQLVARAAAIAIP